MAGKDLIEELRNDEHINADDVVAQVMKVVNRYYQQATVTGVSGNCPYGHCKGDTFKLTSMNSDGLCGAMYQAIHSQIVTLHHGGAMQWENDPDTHSGVCPEGVVHIDVKRIACRAGVNPPFFPPKGFRRVGTRPTFFLKTILPSFATH